MIRAVLLVTTTPGGGPAVLAAARKDDRFTRAIACFGPFEAALEVLCQDHDELLEAIAVVNDLDVQLASETLLDMAVEEEDLPASASRPENQPAALVLLDEDKHRGCHYAHTLFEAVETAHQAVQVCYPLLGRYDDAAWLEAEDLDQLAETVAVLESLDGAKRTLTLVARPS